MMRPWHIGVVFGAGLTVLLAAMAWVSVMVLRLDQAEAHARRQAVLEENVRLALWRMDSALTPLIARESARPHRAYSAGYAVRRTFKGAPTEFDEADVLADATLPNSDVPYILLRFQFEPDGRLTSPQVLPDGVPDSLKGPEAMTRLAAARLAELRSRVPRDALLAALPRERLEPRVVLQTPSRGRQADLPSQRIQQQQRSDAELQARVGNVQQAAVAQWATGATPPEFQNLDAGVVKRVWVSETLLLARRVSVNGLEYVQGCWLDWPAIKQWLANEVRDLLPDLDLEPISGELNSERARWLAALPVMLVPGALPESPAAPLSPVRFTLLIAWVCALLAVVAVVVLVVGIVSLSERRAAFVSAVTHELRTPLTTFRMYTEMLADGMIPDEAKRRRYLEILRDEAGRLGHLIENVLAYARLERRRPDRRVEPIAVRELLDQVRERLAQRAQQADLRLALEADPKALALHVRADAAAVEQILLNLVDNACKYGVAPTDPAIHLQVARAHNHVLFRVRDRGPGIPRSDARRLFRPFRKSARDAAHSAPGVGLGLALSRRLARNMRGELRFDERITDGACFELRLPRVP